MQYVNENASGVGVACLKSRSSQTEDKVSPVTPSLVLVPEKSLWAHLSLRLAMNATVGLDLILQIYWTLFMMVMTLCPAGE